MPLYEYNCEDCGAHAEILVRGQETPHCPACEGTRLQRTLSTFAVSTGGRPASRAAAPGACGRCGDPRGPGACSLN
jgi:putative FmdB family regulatory protein